MQIERVKIDSLSTDPANVRVHDERNLSAIVASLRRFGQQKPIVIDTDGVVRAGNGTLEAARRLGWDAIDAVTTELDGVEVTAYAIADNRTADLAMWDEQALSEQLQSMQQVDADLLAAVSFSESELEKLLSQFEPLTSDESQGQLDETAKVTCPECGHEFST